MLTTNAHYMVKACNTDRTMIIIIQTLAAKQPVDVATQFKQSM